MNKRIIISLLAAFFIPYLGFSQIENKLSFETLGGYEYNYFKSPEEVRVNGAIITKENLMASSILQDISANYTLTNKWNRNNRFRFFAKPSARIFYENIKDSYWSVNLKTKYDHKINRNTKILAEAKIIRMNREGLGGDQDVLINPLGYTLYGGSLGVDFEVFKDNEFRTALFYNFKNFDSYGMRDLQFDEFGIEISNAQKFGVGELRHEIGIDVYIKKRLYDTFNASDLITDGERNWDYAKAMMFYELPFSKQFKVKPNFVYYLRKDNTADRSGFNQFGPGVFVKYDNDKTKISSSFSFITRNYKSIEARNTEVKIGETLKYEYVNFGIDVSHEIRNDFWITATINSKIRNTNYTDIDARSFRNYRNQYIGVGVLWEL
ncbi:hypothetical protein [Aquimarina muelleri]|uniref:Uncharacterized protein n=1 Tax=Aquimarina muelleri TaxID=279356 RepID=A0A918JX52_9FLAO|nr:hypothetical protein [Aquimarina muelleri]MCX2763745.1 hypothetical protein [Aquimarina muelleri]GGX29797.1 hypothetical protein GCM10007384_33690 [Aquimarina muelleri]